MFFTITTNRETADKIKKQCDWDERFQSGRSYEIGEIVHYEGYSMVQINSKDGKKIGPEDIFWLGHHSAGQ